MLDITRRNKNRNTWVRSVTNVVDIMEIEMGMSRRMEDKRSASLVPREYSWLNETPQG